MEERVYGRIPGEPYGLAQQAEEGPSPSPGFKPLRPPGRDLMSEGGSAGNSGAKRMTARTLIQERVRKLRREADGLESLLRSIPEQMPQEADEALWALLFK